MPLGALVLLPALGLLRSGAQLGLLRTQIDAERCAALAAAAKAEPLSAKQAQDKAESELGLTAGAAEFFAEAVGLAASKPDFAPIDFCKSVDHALECSLLMDTVLTSTPVQDLAYGECMRSGEDASYCMQFSSAIKSADVETDLDTLRACYLLKEVKGAGPIAGEANATNEFGAEKPAGPILVNSTVAQPFGVPTQEATVPAEPPRITVEPLHAVRRNGTAYNASHIVAGDGNLHTAGEGEPAKQDLPWVPPPTRHEVATEAAAEGGRAAGAAVGSAMGHEVGATAGEKAGVEAGKEVLESHNGTKEELSDAAYKAGFEAGQKAGKEALSSALVHVANSTQKTNATAVAANATKEPAKAEPKAEPAKAPVKAEPAKAELAKETHAARQADAKKINASALATKSELKEASTAGATQLMNSTVKAELKNELKAELKNELKSELKSELKTDEKAKETKEEYSGFLSKFVSG